MLCVTCRTDAVGCSLAVAGQLRTDWTDKRLKVTARAAEQHRSALPQECHGTGVQVMMRPLGPGMMQQIQQPCSNCRQTGFAPPPQDLCPACSGKVGQPYSLATSSLQGG